MNTSSPTLQAYVTQVTAPNAGAVAIIQIHGSDTPKLLARITGRATFPPSRAVLTNLAGVDQGLAILWRSDWAQLMPHGGPRVVGRILEYCLQQGGLMRDATEISASSLYPEARSPLEADMLATMAQATSPLAVQMLLAQPRCWREALAAGLLADPAAVEHILTNRLAMKHLLTPPTVAVLGRPNVGKSTLTNAMLGRSASIVADMPGTTRDWVAGMMQINGLAIRWLDTPGVRTSEDLIEQQAIIMSQAVIQQADVVVAMRDPQTPWPQAQEGGRPVDLWVMNKLDQLADQSPTKALPKDELAKLGLDASQPIQISAQTGAHLAMLNQAILHRLGAAAWLDEAGQSSCPCWAFSPALVTSLQTGDWVSLRAYVTPVA